MRNPKLIGCKYTQLYGFENFFRTRINLKAQQVNNNATWGIPKLFFMVSDVDSFSAKPVFDLIITTYDHQAVITVLIYKLMV